MTRRHIVGTLACLGFALLVGLGHTFAQQAPAAAPAAAPRPTSTNCAKVELSEVGLPGVASATCFVYNPGTLMAPHKHDGRTSIIIVVSGQLSEHRGDVVKKYNPGDVVTVSNGTTHANENAGTVPLVYVEINISANPPATPAAPAK
jgi:quercetin dioxygenase-like cupin family protein